MTALVPRIGPGVRTAVVVVAAAALAAGCGSFGTLGVDWGRVASVERPVNYDSTLQPGEQRAHPILMIPGQAYVEDLTALPQGGEVAIGYIPPDWTPAAWTSPDAATWTLHSMGATEFTFPVAVAAAESGTTVVAVGRTGSQPIAWTTTDGVTWTARTVPVLGTDGTAERMTSVTAGAGRFVAGGSVGPELGDRRARFWTSADGASWTAVPDDAATFANAEVRSVARVGAGFVAVGVVGSAQLQTGSVAWTSPDGSHWRRVDDPALVGGIAVSVVAAPFGGLVAVGSDLARKEAVAWTSADGDSWTKAPSEPSRRYAGFVWMTDVTDIGNQVLAVGEFQGLQRGTATSWISVDGLHWQQARTAPVQEQGEFYAVAPGGPGAIAVGSFGAPDSYVPEVWVTPGR